MYFKLAKRYMPFNKLLSKLVQICLYHAKIKKSLQKQVRQFSHSITADLVEKLLRKTSMILLLQDPIYK